MTHEEFIRDYLNTNSYLRYRWYIDNGTLYISAAVDFYELGITHITELPDNLHIEQWLDIQGTQITKLSENLYIGSTFYYRKSQIVELPDSIRIGNDVNIGYFNSGHSLLMCEEVQLNLISKNENNFSIIKNPTEKSITMQKLLWKI